MGSLQFRSVEMATLEQGNGQFKYPSLTSFEYEVLPALWHRTGGAEPILIVGASSGSPLNDNPSPTAGTCHARAHNPIRHSTIIGRPRAGWQPRPRLSFPEGTWHILGSQDSDESQQIETLPDKSTLLTLLESNPQRGRSSVSAVDQLRNSYCEELAF